MLENVQAVICYEIQQNNSLMPCVLKLLCKNGLSLIYNVQKKTVCWVAQELIRYSGI